MTKKYILHHNRRSIRLKNYDYSHPGLYFITICTQDKTNLFGKITDNNMILNIAGEMVDKIWLEIPKIFSNSKLHEYVIMPNHFHAIVEITHSIGAEMDSDGAEMDSDGAEMDSAPTGGVNGNVSLPKIVQTFKRYTTIEYIKMVKRHLLPSFERRIWQRNYYEHIIRDEESYLKIVEYIINNPSKWTEDKYYTQPF